LWLYGWCSNHCSAWLPQPQHYTCSRHVTFTNA
jgi:hypothetical protein